MDSSVHRSAHDATSRSADVVRPDAIEVRPTMPVELWFGEDHIGVKANTATCIAFQRFANAILSDFRAAKASNG